MKKRITSILMVVAMAAMLLSGCGSNKAAADKSGDKATDSLVKATTQAVTEATGGIGKGKTVGITVPSIGNDFALNLTKLMQKSLEDVGCKVQLDSAESDVTKQIQQIENDVTMGCDVLIVWATNGEGVSSACKAAVSQGIEVLAFANEIPGASCSMISASDADMGAACAKMSSEWIDKTYADAKDGDVKVLVLTSSVIPEAVTRSDALKKIADNKKVKMTVQEIADWNDSDAARKMTENTLLADPDVDVIVSANGTMAKGAESFVVSSSSTIKDKSKFAIFCVDEDDEIDAKIKDSVDNKSVLRGTISMGTMDDTINDLMKGMTPLLKGDKPQDIHGSAYKVTPDSLKK